jgi:hypothetical protein
MRNLKIEYMEEKKLPERYLEVSKELNSSIVSVIGSKEILGFEKAYTVAVATKKLSDLLSKEYMAPIMFLQGNKLGFKTDKDKDGGYGEEVVKNCLIEAVLTGVQPYGNQFNIIAGNCYITKEGFGYLLKNIEGLSYDIVPSLPRIDMVKESAAVIMKITWRYQRDEGEASTGTREIEFGVKVNKFMGADAVIGKATRKARAWLFNMLMNTEISDGDIDDSPIRMEKNQDTGSYEAKIAAGSKKESKTE